MNRFLKIGVFFGALVILLTACGSSDSGDPTTPAPEAVFTSAAKTAEARRVERFAQTATLPAESLIATSAFSTPTPTVGVTNTVMVQTSPSPSGSGATQPAAGGDRGEYVADVTIPDGTVFAPNQAFQKTWRIANAGQTTWTVEYSLVFIDGALMGAEPSVQLLANVAPGEKVDITVDMVAPPDEGPYRGYWELRNATGQVFGFGPNGNESIWVDIVVDGEATAGLATSTTAASSGAVSGVVLSVDNPQVSGVCPHTFIFTARITLSQPATLGYVLEAGTISGETFRVPLPATQNLGTGEHPVVYELTIPADTVAWARLHVTQPVEAFSNQVDFSLTCG